MESSIRVPIVGVGFDSDGIEGSKVSIQLRINVGIRAGNIFSAFSADMNFKDAGTLVFFWWSDLSLINRTVLILCIPDIENGMEADVSKVRG